jgi:hypothetical protein
MQANNFFDVEWRVNGCWNAIFHRMFHVNGSPGDLLAFNKLQPTFYVAPEAYSDYNATQGLMADLAVFQQDPINSQNGPPAIIYEGKGGTSSDTWFNIYNQLAGWLQTCNLPVNTRVWVIGAKGRQCKFWRYRATGPGTGVLAAVSVAQLKPLFHDGVDPTQLMNNWTFDIAAMEVSIILEYISQNPFN